MLYVDNLNNQFEADGLLPCPFCGGSAEMTFKGNDYTRKKSVTIKCSNCRAQRTDGAIRYSHEWCAKKAISYWNQRKERS